MRCFFAWKKQQKNEPENAYIILLIYGFVKDSFSDERIFLPPMRRISH